MKFEIEYKNLPPFHKEVEVPEYHRLTQAMINLKVGEGNDSNSKSSVLLSQEDYILTLQNIFRELKSVQEITNIRQFSLIDYMLSDFIRIISSFSSKEDALLGDGNTKFDIVLYDINKQRIKEGVYFTRNTDKNADLTPDSKGLNYDEIIIPRDGDITFSDVKDKKSKVFSFFEQKEDANGNVEKLYIKSNGNIINKKILDRKAEEDKSQKVKDSDKLKNMEDIKRRSLLTFTIILSQCVGKGYNFRVDKENNIKFTRNNKEIDINTLSDEKYIVFQLISILYNYIENDKRLKVFLIDAKDFSSDIISAILSICQINALGAGSLGAIFVYNLGDANKSKVRKENVLLKTVELPCHITYSK